MAISIKSQLTIETFSKNYIKLAIPASSVKVNVVKGFINLKSLGNLKSREVFKFSQFVRI